MNHTVNWFKFLSTNSPAAIALSFIVVVSLSLRAILLCLRFNWNYFYSLHFSSFKFVLLDWSQSRWDLTESIRRARQSVRKKGSHPVPAGLD